MTDTPSADQSHPGTPVPPDAPVTGDDRNMALIAHLSLLAHLVIPVIALLIPILIWQAKKTDSAFAADHAREATNFHISLLIYSVIIAIIAVPVGFLTCGIGFVIVVFPYVLGLIGMILACMATGRSELYRYPMTIRMLA